ncbi:PepSY domain-containing protein [Streptomyces mexicanus]|uniref:PepSY domain-containing protein n=1 Tax=Streptomyces mexicanus TaxID=178566 RepID=UPI003651B8C9
MAIKSNDAVVRRRRLPVARALGVVCAVAAAGGLLTGCGGDDKADTATKSPPADPLRAAAASPSPTSPSPASPSSPASAGGENLTEDQAERKAIVPKVKVGYDKALDAALKAVPGAKPVSIDLKGPRDHPTWKAEVASADGTGHTVRVDAVTGKAGQARTDADQDSDDKRELADRLKKATVTVQQAAKAATDRTKGTVTSVDLGDTDQGTPKWSVDVVDTSDWNKTTYDIDATDRKILREHVDRD